MLKIHNPSYGSALACTILITLSIVIYYTGLNGEFLFDDFANLNKLGDYNGVRNLDTLIQYLTSGIAGPTGRPISLLSFLIDGSNWPTDPYPFKRTNLIIHCINGVTLFFIIQLITSSSKKKSSQPTLLLAFLGTALWLWHPFHVSTVLYVVQRMAMLSTLFSLLGILAYCYGRQQLIYNKKSAYWYMTLGVVMGTILAVFSKENGALLPLLILCIETTIFSSYQNTLPSINKRWSIVFLIIPSIVIILYLLSFINIDHFDVVKGRRHFSLKQRLLTESRLVIGYLYNIFIPQMFYSGIFNENIQLSTSLLKPLSTLFSVITVSLLPLLAFWQRKKHPYIALALLFFFAGHILESSTIKLELYFEHRNYLPSVFLFLPVVLFCQTHQSKLIQISLLFFLLVCMVFTYNRTSLWGNQEQLSLFWAQQNQNSARAQKTAALTLSSQGKNTAALSLLTKAKNNFPNDIDVFLHWAMLQCQINNLSNDDFKQVTAVVKQQKYASTQFNILEAFINFANEQNCTGLSNKQALIILNLLKQNPSVRRRSSINYQFNHLSGLVLLRTQQPTLAYKEFTSALNKTKRVDHGFLQSGLLATYKAFNLALKHLERTEKLLPKQKNFQYFSKNNLEELQYLRKTIKQDAFDHLQ